MYNRKMKTWAYSVYTGDLLRFGGATWMIDSVEYDEINHEQIIKGARLTRGEVHENSIRITLVLDPHTRVTLVQ